MAAVRKPANNDSKNNSLNCADAKSYLCQAASKNDANLYDHLTRLLTKLLDERPANGVELFEDYSRKVKEERFVSSADNLHDRPDKPAESELAETQLNLFARDGDVGADEEHDYSALPNLLQITFYLEQSGIGLSREEMIRIWLALRTLVETQPVEQVDEQNEDKDEKEKDYDATEEAEAEVDYIPQPNYKRPPVVPVEEQRTGANKLSYFVCNEPGGAWNRLPAVTPTQIATARNIKKFFTGRLDTPVASYPPFPGSEANYLRAQIARISAGTQISPAGFYLFDEEDDEQAKLRGLVQLNPEFEPLPIRDLVEPSLSSWVHHVLYILPQGRTTWWNPISKSADDADDDDDEDREDRQQVEPEVGPPLLTPLSEDAEVDGMIPWTTRVSSKLISQYAVAVVHSCLWPGAHAFCTGRNFENIYIGWGHKYSAVNYSPPAVVPVQVEYPQGPEISEASDPTPEEEKALSKDAAGDGGEGDLGEHDDELLDDGAIAEEDEGGDDDDDDDDDE